MPLGDLMSLSLFTYPYEILVMESLPSHIRLISSLFFNIVHFRYADNTKDECEAQWYEPWDAILNWLCLITNENLTVAPQPCIVRLVNAQYEGW